MKTSFITTVLNEEETIRDLLRSIDSQTLPPEEVIIVDGGSKDNTLSVISNFKFKISKNVRVLVKKGNRSVGRNEAIKKSSGDVILCTDSGCVLDKFWIENITRDFRTKKVDVVSGYYKGLAKTSFEKAMIPFVLVMEDKVNEDNFLPATRSIAFTKSIWEKAGGFNEKYSNNEDYIFARKLRKIGAKISFAKDAVVFWRPRKNLKEASNMFYRFAKGDSESGILRPKVVLIFIRYLIAFLFAALFVYTNSLLFPILILVSFVSYVICAALKNYKYVDNLISVFYLVILQFVSDFAVIAGTFLGILTRLGKRS